MKCSKEPNYIFQSRAGYILGIPVIISIFGF